MDPEILSAIVGHTINRTIPYKQGQTAPIDFFSLQEEGYNGVKITWESLVFDKSIVTLRVVSHDTADIGAEKFNSLCPKYTKSGYRICNRSGITLRNLTEGVCRMKGLEYPWYHARYHGIEINHESPESIVVKFHYVK